MPRAELTVDEIMAILPETPGRIAALTAAMGDEQLRAAPAPDEWSVGELLAHLRASHDVLGGSMLRILAEDRPAWRRLSPRTWMRKTDYLDWDFAPAFAAFRQERADLLKVLDATPRKAWTRVAVVTDPNKQVVERSVRFYGDWMAAHEVEHLAQIEATVAAVTGRRVAPG